MLMKCSLQLAAELVRSAVRAPAPTPALAARARRLLTGNAEAAHYLSNNLKAP